MKATYIAIAAVAPALLLSGGTLTWNGGETWDSLTASWVDETGEPSVWTDGSVASFPDGGTIALAADVNVSSLLVGGRSFTLSGEGVLRVEEGGAIVVSTPDATIACPVQTAGALSVQSGSELISGIEGVYLSTNEWRKVAEGVSLDTLKNLSMTDHSKGWNAEGYWNWGIWVDFPNGGVQTVDSFGNGLTDRKLRIISQSEEKVLVEYRRLQENYSVRLIAAMLIEFRSEGDGILAKVAASKTIRIPDGGETNISNYDTYSYENLGLAAHAEKGGKDWPFLIYGDAPWTNETLPSWKGCGGKAENWPESDLVGAIGDFTGFKFQGKSQLVFSGAFQAGGALSLEDGLAVTFEGPLSDVGGSEAVFTHALTSAATPLVFANCAPQTLGGIIKTTGAGTIDVASGSEITLTYTKNENYGKNHTAAWRILGTVTAKHRNAFAQASETGALQSEILSGGRLVLSFSDGVDGSQPLIVRERGLLILEGKNCLFSDKPITVEAGGVVSNAFLSADSDGTREADKVAVKNSFALAGGRFTGSTLWFGYESWGWKDTSLTVSGSAPSVIELGKIVIDFPGGILKGSCVANLNVADATGNGDSDLVVESPIVRRSNGSEPTDYTRWAYGIRKQGAGTLELRGVSTFGQIGGEPAGQTFLAAGTLRLAASTAGSSFGRLQLEGDATLQLDEGARVAFADSTQISGTNPNDGGAAYSWAWDESATLTLANKLAPKSIRFGTDANGLAADQLAKIRYDESVTTKTVVFTLDAEGYLRDNLDRGIFMRIR